MLYDKKKTQAYIYILHASIVQFSLFFSNVETLLHVRFVTINNPRLYQITFIDLFTGPSSNYPQATNTEFQLRKRNLLFVVFRHRKANRFLPILSYLGRIFS